MFQTIKDYINTGRYELKELTNKINALWVESELTDEEREALLSLAQENADQSKGYASLQEQLDSLKTYFDEKIKAINPQLVELGNKVNQLIEGETPDSVPEPEPEPEEEYPAWHTPTGAHDAYYTNDKMTFTDGKKYICIAPAGYGVTYGPDVLPQMWQLVEDTM
jgi:hypothetical protein|nr:MAG TPA: hypothetical protein [Caudoviricetes sp.]